METYNVRLHDIQTQVTFEFSVVASSIDHAKLLSGAYMNECDITLDNMVIWQLIRKSELDRLEEKKVIDSAQTDEPLAKWERDLLWPSNSQIRSDYNRTRIYDLLSQGTFQGFLQAIRLYREQLAEKGPYGYTPGLAEAKAAIEDIERVFYPQRYNGSIKRYPRS